MFVDTCTIMIKSGNGGNGAISFYREKYVPNGGPDGGDGGRGGGIYFVADEKLNNLVDFHFKRKYVAEDGEKGSAKNCTGRNGKDLLVEVPVGTVVRDAETGRIIADMFFKGEKKLILPGGSGGKGNARFSSSRRQAPSFSQNGEKIELRKIVLELKTIADIGLVGMPNAGKSTLLSVISAARPKIANYHFTTLSPNLGVVRYYEDSFVAADIPGLIEGASRGAGLGHDFLRHIERTRMIVHVVDMSGLEGDPRENFRKINAELSAYSATLADKPQLVAANKMDLPEAKERYEEFVAEFGNSVPIFKISAFTKTGLEALLKSIFEKLREMPAIAPLEFVPYEYEKRDSDEYDILRNDDGSFEVAGPLVDRLARNVVFDDSDSFAYFQRMLRDKGVIDRLRKMGVKEGDTVILGEIEFDFVN